MEMEQIPNSSSSYGYVNHLVVDPWFRQIIGNFGQDIDLNMFTQILDSPDVPDEIKSFSVINVTRTFYHYMMLKDVDDMYYKNQGVYTIDELMSMERKFGDNNPYYCHEYVIYKYMDKINRLKERGPEWLAVMKLNQEIADQIVEKY